MPAVHRGSGFAVGRCDDGSSCRKPSTSVEGTSPVVDESHGRVGLTVSGVPMSSPLRNVRELSRRMVGHVVENVAPCGTLPTDAVSGDVAAITRVSVEFAIGMLDGRNVPARTKRLERAAAQWAREGVPIDRVHQAVHEGVKMGLETVVAGVGPARRDAADDNVGLTLADYENLVDGAKLVVDLLNTMSSAISRAYVHELRSVATEHHTAVHTLASALLGGYPTSTIARECGIEIAKRYSVLALSIPAHPDESDPALDARVVARRKLRRVQAELAGRCGEKALSLLSVDGGTVLIPAAAMDDAALDDVVARLSAAAHVPLTAAVVSAPTERIPAATDEAHELLDIVQRLRVGAGLYRFDELCLEYQLTRPGSGRELLGGLLDPLDDHPELLETLRRHIANDLNRRVTARTLHVHTNTVDYRLRRIGQLTGLDPTEADGLWRLRSALIARSYIADPPT